MPATGKSSDIIDLGSKPKLITRITSGTGTYVPTADMARCFVRVQGAGASGGAGDGSIGGGGGGAGAMVEAMVRIPIAGLAYMVGAGGGSTSTTNGVSGGASRLGTLWAEGGSYGIYRAVSPSSATSRGGGLSNFGGAVNAAGAFISAVGGVAGVAGGSGGAGYNSKGSPPGFPVSSDATLGWSDKQTGLSATSALGGGGGDSFFGTGGNGATTNPGNGSAGSGYGSGGGGAIGASTGVSGAGAGGCIEIWDYGV